MKMADLMTFFMFFLGMIIIFLAICFNIYDARKESKYYRWHPYAIVNLDDVSAISYAKDTKKLSIAVKGIPYGMSQDATEITEEQAEQILKQFEEKLHGK